MQNSNKKVPFKPALCILCNKNLFGEVGLVKGSKDLPLLLLDNSSMMSVLNKGEFKCNNLTFEEAKHMLDIHNEEDILRCFNNTDIETIIFDYLGIRRRNFTYKHIRNMRPGQDAIVFKLYITPSETQPVIQADDGVEAKKIQNCYVYCQHLMRIT